MDERVSSGREELPSADEGYVAADIGEDESARRRPISAKALEHSTMLA